MGHHLRGLEHRNTERYVNSECLACEFSGGSKSYQYVC